MHRAVYVKSKRVYVLKVVHLALSGFHHVSQILQSTIHYVISNIDFVLLL